MLKRRKMKLSLIFPKNKNESCNEIGYDLNLDFSKFLEEAINQTSDAVLSLPMSDSFEKVEMKDRKNKKTWKRSISFWFKFQKKGARKELATPKTKSLKDSNLLDAEHRWFSGPLFGNGSRFALIQQKIRLSTSGSLASCFTPTRADETEVPYRYLDHHNNPLGAQAFGPIYLVT